MSALSRSRAASSILRPCLASTSRLTPSQIRSYATPTENVSVDDYDYTAHTYGTTTERKSEGAVIRRYNGKGMPTLNSTRHRVSIYHPHLWNGGPLKDLTIPLRRKGGRDTTGQIVTRHIGGGHKRRLRAVDFYRYAAGVHDVIRIEYDPGRSAHIALLRRRDWSLDVGIEEGAALAEKEMEGEMPADAGDFVRGGWSYILAPDGLRAGDQVRSFRLGIPQGLVEGWGQPVEELDEEDEVVPVPVPVEIAPVPLQITGGRRQRRKQLRVTADAPVAVAVAVEETIQPTPKPKAVGIVDPAKFDVSPRALGLLRTVTLKPGNVLPLYLIPPGTTIHNISFGPLGKMKAARSAGTSAQIVAHQGANGEALGGTDVLKMGSAYDDEGNPIRNKAVVLVKMTSGEVRKLSPKAVATIGFVSNKEHSQIVLGKAGRARWLGRKPRTRGVAMNANDHPHGGGKGKSKAGKQAHSYSGKLTKGVRTRRPKDKNGNKAVVTERPRGPHSGTGRR